MPEKSRQPGRFKRIIGRVKGALGRKIIPFSSSKRELLFRLGAWAAIGAAVTHTPKLISTYKEEARPKHEVTLAFGVKQEGNDAKHLKQLIETAKAVGEPFHAIGYENEEEMPAEEYDEVVGLIKKTQDLRKEAHRLRVKAGLTEDEADEEDYRQIVNNIGGGNSPEHRAAVEFLALKYNLPLVPIVIRDKKEIELNEKFYKTREGALGNILSLPTLEKQVKEVEELARVTSEFIHLENNKIAFTVPLTISELRLHYPKLPKHGVRILYPLHAYRKGRFDEQKLEKEKVEVQYTSSPHPHTFVPSIEQKLNGNPQAKLDSIEKARLILAANLSEHRNKLLQEGSYARIQEIASKLAKVTEKDFKHLNQETAEKPLEEKASIIRDYLLKMK